VQRLTWSSHKNRNLVKAMMLVCPDGYIWNAECCFFANGDNNDAKIFEALLSKDKEESLKSCLKSGDAMLLDRGFRDVLPKIESLGVQTFMPQFMSKDQKQLSTEQAKISRKVTMGRFVVETVNGRLKNVFRCYKL